MVYMYKNNNKPILIQLQNVYTKHNRHHPNLIQNISNTWDKKIITLIRSYHQTTIANSEL